MKRNLLEYLNDLTYAMGHCTANDVPSIPRIVSGERESTFIRLSPEERVSLPEEWNDNALAELDPADVPQIMATKRLEIGTSKSKRAPQLTVGQMRMIWGDWTPTGKLNVSRKVGPAYILIEDQRFYYVGEQTPVGAVSLKVKSAKFYWVKDGNYARHNGPHEVRFSVRMVANGNNTFTPKFETIEIGWNDGRGRRIPMSALDTALRADDEMEVDPFAVDSSFDSPLDEMAFWSEVKF